MGISASVASIRYELRRRPWFATSVVIKITDGRVGKRARMAAVKSKLKRSNVFIAPELMLKMAEALDTSEFYGVEVTSDIDIARGWLTLIDCRTLEPLEAFFEKARVIFGSIEFGYNRYCEYYVGGNVAINEAASCCSYDMMKPFAAIVSHYSWDTATNNVVSYKTLFIYSPDSIEDETEDIRMKKAELDNICQLRGAKPVRHAARLIR